MECNNSFIYDRYITFFNLCYCRNWTGLGAFGGFAAGVAQEAVEAIGDGEFSWGDVATSMGAGTLAGATTGAIVGASTGDPSALILIIGAAGSGAVGGAVTAIVEDIRSLVGGEGDFPYDPAEPPIWPPGGGCYPPGSGTGDDLISLP